MWALLALLALLAAVWFWGYQDDSSSGESQPVSDVAEVAAERTHAASLPRRPAFLRYLAACPCCGERLIRRDHFT